MPPLVKLSQGDLAFFQAWHHDQGEFNAFLLRALTDIYEAITALSLAKKSGTIEIIGELDGVPAELVGEYTTQ